MSMEDFLPQIMEARSFEEANSLGLFVVGREISSEELMWMTDEGVAMNSDLERGIVYGRHATGLADRNHRKHGGGDFTITP